ncbi:MAG: DHA1 family bicyclomycin/chloramphenicol resistance-like MFS transporter [Paracoccaceae bacterium]|jgi:DHA1 family bicyclomycin/chloramphenicol resistance-like MFS transporter
MSVSTKSQNQKSPPHIATLILMSGLAALAMNVFLPSLPGMSEFFQTDYRLMQLSVALYLGTSAVFQLFIGPLSDNIGRRPVILGGMAIFMVATVGCLFSTSIEVFLFFRMCQTSIAVTMVLSRAIVRDIYPADKAASMIGYVTMGMAVVPMLGPAIGGALDHAFGWHANFWLLLGLGGLTMVLVWADLGETVTKTGQTLRQQFGEYPELLRSPRFWGYSIASGASSGAFFAYLGGAPFIGSVVFGLTPSTLGIVFGLPALGYIVGNFLTGRYALRVGINGMVMWGCITALVGVVLTLIVFMAGLATPYSFFGLMIFIGLGNGMTIPNATAGMLSVRPNLAGTASGLGGAMMIGVGAALSALAGSLLTLETGAYPLLYIQLLTTTVGLISILVVIRRQKQLDI